MRQFFLTSGLKPLVATQITFLSLYPSGEKVHLVKPCSGFVGFSFILQRTSIGMVDIDSLHSNGYATPRGLGVNCIQLIAKYTSWRIQEFQDSQTGSGMHWAQLIPSWMGEANNRPTTRCPRHHEGVTFPGRSGRVREAHANPPSPVLFLSSCSRNTKLQRSVHESVCELLKLSATAQHMENNKSV